MVWIPPGTFENTDKIYPEEFSGKSKTVSGFWMDRTETTNDEFANFVRETGYVTEAENSQNLHGEKKPTNRLYESGSVVFQNQRRKNTITIRWNGGISFRELTGVIRKDPIPLLMARGLTRLWQLVIKMR